MGRLLIIIGAALMLLGVVLTFAPGLLGWFGRLPGDIRIERPGGTLYVPLTSMIILSVAVSLIVNVLWRR